MLIQQGCTAGLQALQVMHLQTGTACKCFAACRDLCLLSSSGLFLQLPQSWEAP